MKPFFPFLSMLLLSVGSRAQKAYSAIAFGGDYSIPTGNFGRFFKSSPGFYTRALFAVGSSVQLSFSGGYNSYRFLYAPPGVTLSIKALPLMAGFRCGLNSLFVEPQAGYGIVTISRKSEDEEVSASGSGFAWGLSAGFVVGRQLEISGRYQNIKGQGADNITAFGLRLGYNLAF